MTILHDPTNPVFDDAARLARLGVSVIPIQRGTKEPAPGFKWGVFAERLADVSERFNWFVEHDHHLAAVAGPVSGNLVILDFDGPGDGGYGVFAAEHPAITRLPRVRTGSGKVHVWLRTATAIAKYAISLPGGGRLEVRAATHYTLCPPSLHPSGQPYVWEIEPWAGIPVVDLARLGIPPRAATAPKAGRAHQDGEPLSDADQTSLYEIVEPHYIPDHRHDLCLALAGWLANLDVPETDARVLMTRLAFSHGDQGREREYARAVHDSYTKAGNGVAVAGWARLTDTANPLLPTSAVMRLDLLMRSRMPTVRLSSNGARPEPPTVKGKGITLAELQVKRFAPLKWLIDGMLPEGGLLLCGRPKSKKSWLALGLGLAIALGGVALGGIRVTQGRVLYLDLEGNQARIKSRVNAILGSEEIDWPHNFHLFTVGEWPEGEAGMRELGQWFLDHPDTAFVVIDVLQDFRPPIGPKENAYDYDRNTLKALNALAERYHAGIAIIHHTRKAKGDDALDEVSGTLGAPSAVSTIWVLSRAEDGQHTILKQRGRDLFNEDDLALRWDPANCIHYFDGSAEEVNASAERRAVLRVLEDDQSHTLKEIAAEVSKSLTATVNLLTKLVSLGFVDKTGRGTYARVPRKR